MKWFLDSNLITKYKIVDGKIVFPVVLRGYLNNSHELFISIKTTRSIALTKEQLDLITESQKKTVELSHEITPVSEGFQHWYNDTVNQIGCRKFYKNFHKVDLIPNILTVRIEDEDFCLFPSKLNVNLDNKVKHLEYEKETYGMTDYYNCKLVGRKNNVNTYEYVDGDGHKATYDDPVSTCYDDDDDDPFDILAKDR